MSARKVWSAVDTELLRLHYADSRTEDLAVVLSTTVPKVLGKANSMGLKKSPELVAQMAREAMDRPDHGARKHNFPKGHVPANKGLRRPGFVAGDMARTQFKKGNRPHTWVPVGSYRVNPDGQLEVKLNDDPGPYFVRWKPVHRLVWEAKHGPVPAGMKLAFKPGMKTTDPKLITVDVLELLTHAELMARNTIHRYPDDLKKAIRLVAKVKRKLHERTDE